MKAYIITMSDRGDSAIASKKCFDSIKEYHSKLEPVQWEAIQPPRLYEHIVEIFEEFVTWSWPEKEHEDRLDLFTNLFLRHYKTTDINRVKACALSHMKLWKKSVDDNETMVILEHDAQFIRHFDPDDLVWDKSWGAVALNNPQGATRKGQHYHSLVSILGEGIHKIPAIDNKNEPPLPHGLPGNSAYIIRPHAAKELLQTISKLGIWPNDAIMCTQLFPWLRISYPYYTELQGVVSTTTQS